jgi:hypothetical protein
MKIFFSLLLTLGMATPALAQGKVRLVNDSLHLVYWDPSFPGPLAGQPYLLGSGGGVTLTIELWAGTSSTALSLQATTDFTGQLSPGTWVGSNVLMPSAPAGMNFFEILIYDVAAGSWQNAHDFGHVWGTESLFTAVAGGGTPYNSLVQHTSPAFSTWADGDFNMDSISPGYRGAIMLTISPEPSTLGLSCLGVALLLLRRRTETIKVKS